MLLHFVFGGLSVTVFSLVGELFRPKTFAGLFSSAPSVAVASLALAYVSKGRAYVEVEALAMSIGALALLAYAAACVTVARKSRSIWLGTVLAWGVWGAVAFAADAMLRAVGVTK